MEGETHWSAELLGTLFPHPAEESLLHIAFTSAVISHPYSYCYGDVHRLCFLFKHSRKHISPNILSPSSTISLISSYSPTTTNNNHTHSGNSTNSSLPSSRILSSQKAMTHINDALQDHSKFKRTKLMPKHLKRKVYLIEEAFDQWIHN